MGVAGNYAAERVRQRGRCIQRIRERRRRVERIGQRGRGIEWVQDAAAERI